MVIVAFVPGRLLYNLRVDVPAGDGTRLYKQRVTCEKGILLRLRIAPSTALIIFEDGEGRRVSRTVQGIPFAETITTIYTGQCTLLSVLVRGPLVIFAQVYDGLAA